LLICGDDFVAHLHEELERKLGLLRGDGDVMQFFAFAGEKALHAGLRVVLETFDFRHRVRERALKGARGTPRRLHRRRRRCNRRNRDVRRENWSGHGYLMMSIERLIMSLTEEIAATLAWYDRDAFIRSTMSSAGFMRGKAT